MTGILSLITFAPMIGVAAILALRAMSAGQDTAVVANRAKIVALVTSLVTLALSVFLVSKFDAKDTGFQFVETVTWFSGATYRMGVDGISILFVLLTAFLLPICILASWESR